MPPEEFFARLDRKKLEQLVLYYGYHKNREDEKRAYYTSRVGEEFFIDKKDPFPLVWFDDLSDALQIGVLSPKVASRDKSRNKD